MRKSRVPERTCVGCHTRRPKPELVRVARIGETVAIDQRKRLPGRGAYFCASEGCWQAGVKRGLNRALRVNLPAGAGQELLQVFTMGDRTING